MTIDEVTVGIIGCGNLGGALVRGLATLGANRPKNIIAFDPQEGRTKEFEKLGVEASSSIPALIAKTDVAIVAVKPVDIEAALGAVKASLGSSGLRCLISVAAGVSVARLSSLVGGQLPVVRVMPNLPSVIGKGVCGIYAPMKDGKSSEFVTVTESLFSAIGETVVVKKESDINTITSLSAGGPAFTALFIEALADGGVKMGLTREQALPLAVQTVLGTAEMLKQTGLHPSQLREQVASPGGTTIHGLHALEKGAVRATVIAAVEAATKRAEEMQKLSDAS